MGVPYSQVSSEEASKNKYTAQLQTELKELKDVNEDHRKLNGVLRKELDDAWDCINAMRYGVAGVEEAYNHFLNINRGDN